MTNYIYYKNFVKERRTNGNNYIYKHKIFYTAYDSLKAILKFLV
jgi:hypothetical protein